MADSGLRATPEVEPVSAMLLHPLLQDPKFLAAAVGLLLILVLYTGKSSAGS